MREVRNGRRSPEIVLEKKEGDGVERPDLTSRRLSSGARGEKEVKV
jgi:hypothetical protein